MKILMADNFYYLRGGAQRYFFNLAELLASRGHRVIPFSVDYGENLDTVYKMHFARPLGYTDIGAGRNTVLGKVRMAVNSIYSFEAKRKIRGLIRAEGPDIVHTHSIPYRLTSSVIDAAYEEGVPVVHTCHEWKALCPNQRLFKSSPPGVCERCKGGSFYNAVRERCIKGSLGSSVVGCLEAYLCRFSGTYSRKIKRFVVPSRFVRDKMVDYGFDPERIDFVPHFVDLEKFDPVHSGGDYILYYGHLTPQKGVRTLIKAMERVRGMKLLVVGGGEVASELKETAAKIGTENIEFRDYIPGDAVFDYVRGAAFTVMPSVWFETAGLVLYESFALGKPVIGSNIGPIPELIEDGETGLLFEFGNPDDLAEKINYLVERPEMAGEMGKKGRRKVEDHFNSCLHYTKIMDVYKKALAIGACH